MPFILKVFVATAMVRVFMYTSYINQQIKQVNLIFVLNIENLIDVCINLSLQWTMSAQVIDRSGYTTRMVPSICPDTKALGNMENDYFMYISVFSPKHGWVNRFQVNLWI